MNRDAGLDGRGSGGEEGVRMEPVGEKCSEGEWGEMQEGTEGGREGGGRGWERVLARH